MATGPSPNDLTRQQLDELDTLLQRMLTQPGVKAPAPMPAVVPDTSWRTDKPAGPVANVPHLVPDAAHAPRPTRAFEPALLAPRTPDPEPPAPVLMAPPPVAEPFPVKLFDPPPEPEEEPIPLMTAPPAAAFERIDLATVPPAAPQPMPQMPADVASPAGGFSPLAVCNELIEGTLSLFGPPGRMLTTGPAKHVLGAIGVLLLIGSGVWTARGFGLVTIPLP